MTDTSPTLPIAEKKQALHQVSLFENISETTLDQVADAMETVTYAPDAMIFCKGDPGSSMYVIYQGTVRIHDGELVFNRLGPGEFFGEMAVLDPEVRSLSASADDEAILFRLDQERLYALVDMDTAVAQQVIHTLCQRLRARSADVSRDYAYIQQVHRISDAANEIEAGVYRPEVLDEVATRSDELGDLARHFQKMANQIKAREKRLQNQVRELLIEVDRAKQEQQVSEIVETDFFRDLQIKAQRMRNRSERRGED